MRENGREEEKQENWSPSRQKFIHWTKSLWLQFVQLAYVATKTSKLPKSTKAINCYKDKMGRNQKEEQKGKTSNGKQEQCVRSEQCAGGMNSAAG